MLTLSQSLEKCDLGFLRIVAELWGLDLEIPVVTASRPEEAAQNLVQALLEPDLVAEILEALPAEARNALAELQSHQGALAWSQFTRKYGEIREMGPGRRDREKPHLNPASAVEMLWYRGLIFRAFLDTPGGPQEFACIPSDLAALLPEPTPSAEQPPGRPAAAAERLYLILANDRLLDHACTLLAALRLNLELDAPEVQATAWESLFPHAPSREQLLALLLSLGLVDAQSRMPEPEVVRQFLEMPRVDALAHLSNAWMHNSAYNELSQLPGVSIEGDWQNDPLRTRLWLLDMLAQIPEKSWWSLPSFISAVKTTQPDFQRPAGDYDSWYLRDQASGEFLRGFENWDRVEGALIRFMITGPLHWLGILDLAAPAQGAAPAAFRFSTWARHLLHGSSPPGLTPEEGKLLVSSTAQIRAPRLVPPPVRYQIARFCEWVKVDQDAYYYRLTPASLLRARKQSLKTAHLIALLNRHAKAVPPNLVRALQRWEERGSEARIETATILRLRSPELLQAVRLSPLARFLGDPLGPTVITIKPGATQKVLALLAELGYLAEEERHKP
ncbi:MAG TPA: helicase-associated domain-containing protein [Anaerolineales bacterium]|nr:helicase-associated domain-containing protein [Anaerolineales bacterium]